MFTTKQLIIVIAIIVIVFGCIVSVFGESTIERYPEVLYRPTWVADDGSIVFFGATEERANELGYRKATQQEIIDFWARVDERSPLRTKEDKEREFWEAFDAKTVWQKILFVLRGH